MKPHAFRRDPSHGPGLKFNLLTCVLIGSLLVVLIYIRSLIYSDTPSIIFDVAHLVSVVALSTILIKSWRTKFRYQILLVLAWILTMRLMIPLRFPTGIMTNYPDMIYELQIIKRIAASGTIALAAPTSYALGYVFTPMLETLVVMSGLVFGVPFDFVLKYVGPFFGVITIAFLVGFYQAFLTKREAILAGFIAGSCFWFVRFDALSVHQPLALAFLSVVLYTLTKQGVAWRFLTILSTFAMVASHEFTAIVSSVFFIIAALGILLLARWFDVKRGAIESSMLKMPGLSLTLTFAWLAFVALPFFATSVGFADFVVATLLGSTSPISFPLTIAKGIPNSWDRIVGDIGILLFAATSSAGFLMALFKRELSDYKQLLPYAAAGGILFVIGLISYLRLYTATDLLSRGFIYVYFFAAPLSLAAALKIVPAIFRNRVNYQQFVSILLITLIVGSGVYYQYPRFLHDNSATLDLEDVRFPLFQWQAAGYFILNHAGTNTIWGDKIAFDYVGGYGERNIYEPDKTLNMTLAQWVSTYPSSGDIVILRQSMTV